MRTLLAALVVLLCMSESRAQAPAAAPPAVAPAIAQADRAEIQSVITRQIEALRRDDAEAAFAFASPSIQRQMGTPERFLDLVQGHYQPVYRPRSTAFGDIESQDGLVIQKLQVIGPDGRGALALYSMEHEPDGTWRIAGCTLAASQALET